MTIIQNKNPIGIDIDRLKDIYTEMIKDTSIDDDSRDLYMDLQEKAILYAGIRAKWSIMGRAERYAEDDRRTKCHDRLIDCINILARYARSKGRPAAWRDALGQNRKDIGDLACFIAFVNGIASR